MTNYENVFSAGPVCACLLLLAACAASPAQPADGGLAEYNLGVTAFQAKDYAGAYQHWSAVANAGNLNALNNLGYLIYYGLGTPAQPQRAITLWRSAAEHGQSESQWHLGNAYADGIGVDRDLPTAYAWYRCSIETAMRRAKVPVDTPEDRIAQDARRSLAQLTDKLDGNELELGKALAGEFIEQYAGAEPAAPPALP